MREGLDAGAREPAREVVAEFVDEDEEPEAGDGEKGAGAGEDGRGKEDRHAAGVSGGRRYRPWEGEWKPSLYPFREASGRSGLGVSWVHQPFLDAADGGGP